MFTIVVIRLSHYFYLTFQMVDNKYKSQKQFDLHPSSSFRCTFKALHVLLWVIVKTIF